MTTLDLSYSSAQQLPLYEHARSSSQYLDMLRYRPSLEFSPATVPPQSAMLALYSPKTLSVTLQSDFDDETKLIAVNCKETVPKVANRLQSLLDILRKANAGSETTVSLVDFVRQVQDRVEDVEAALQKQAAIDAATTRHKLMLLVPDSPHQACSTSYGAGEDPKPCLNFEESEPSMEGIGMELDSQTTRRATLRSQSSSSPSLRGPYGLSERIHKVERPALQHVVKVAKHPDLNENFTDGIDNVEKELQHGLRAFANSSSSIGQHYSVEVVLNQLPGTGTDLQHDYKVQFGPTKVQEVSDCAHSPYSRVKTEDDADDRNQDILRCNHILPGKLIHHEGYNGDFFQHVTSFRLLQNNSTAKLNPQGRALSECAKTASCEMRRYPQAFATNEPDRGGGGYSIKDVVYSRSVHEAALCVGLAVLSVTDHLKPRRHWIPEMFHRSSEDLQNRHSDVETTGLDTSIARVCIPVSSPTCPEISTLHRVHDAQQNADSPKKFEVIETTPLIPTTELRQDAGISTVARKQLEVRDKDEEPCSRARLPSAPIEKTVSHIKFQKKQPSAKPGPDHFLSLLDLVQKK